jgi:hypothetical protein
MGNICGNPQKNADVDGKTKDNKVSQYFRRSNSLLKGEIKIIRELSKSI